MIKKQAVFLCILLISFFDSAPGVAQLQSPAEFLGYESGERWTPHHKLLEYTEHVAVESDFVTLHSYGETYQHRKLVYLVVTAPENHENIEEIRLNNLKLTGLEPGDPTVNQKAIVWLSYNIHGNEPSGSEAALQTLYELVRPDNTASRRWLRNTVVIIDPMVNPDGRERYINWYNRMLGVQPNPAPVAREHREPWPGGRSNHYLFDLNRDWAWQVQKESQYRYKVYRRWFPHIHVDYHEQNYDAPYYFAPAAEPFHKAITEWQREFQNTIGQNHIRYFDENNWLYFTRERFDLFYPSYGDTWPTFQGAVGMTYEMPGHGQAGLAVQTADGDTLTLAQRILQHHTTGMSTVEVASGHAETLIEQFRNYFETRRSDPEGRYKTFVIKAENNRDKIYHLLRDLDSKKIRYGAAGASRRVNGFDFSTGGTSTVSIEEDDILIHTNQPQGNLVRVLFEPNPELADSLTYDITAWEAHYRYGLKGYALETLLEPNVDLSPDKFRNVSVSGSERPYAYLLRWQSLDDARFLATITRKGVKSRFSGKPFKIGDETYPGGTLVITRSNNSRLGNSLDKIVREAASEYGRRLHGVSTGFVSEGSDFGSTQYRFIEKPNIILLAGEGTSSLNVGEIWHYFDHQLEYPTTLIHTQDIMKADLHDFNVLILPAGSYSGILTDTAIEKISAWTRDGGTLIVFGEANSLLTGRDGFQLQKKINDITGEKPEEEDLLQPHAEQERRRLSTRTPGSIYSVTMDTTHPLAFGYDEMYYSLKSDAEAYQYLDTGVNVGTSRGDAHLSGFAGHLAREKLRNSLNFGVQPHGNGQVVYFIDNPLFRGFWENGKLLMANAVFFVGS